MLKRPGESSLTCALRIASRIGLTGLAVLLLLYFVPGLVLLFSLETPKAGCSRWQAVWDSYAVVREADAAEALRPGVGPKRPWIRVARIWSRHCW